MNRLQADLMALTEQWRARARIFMAEAEHSARPADVVRLAASAVTLEWAASDVARYTQTYCAAIQLLAAEAPPDYTPRA